MGHRLIYNYIDCRMDLFSFLKKYYKNKYDDDIEVMLKISKTRLFEVWRRLLFYDNLSQEEMTILVSLLVYGDDPLFGDIMRFAKQINHNKLFSDFKLISDAVCLADWMDSEFKGSPGEPISLVGESEQPSIGEIHTEEGSLQQETTTFLDNQVIRILDLSQRADPTRSQADHQESNALGSFLSRPVSVLGSGVQLVPGNPLSSVRINVWQDLFNAYILKIQNFRLFRCTSLRVQFRINGSPFHYGRYYVSYVPGLRGPVYSGQNEPTNSSLQPSNYGSFNTITDPLKTHWSQYPGVFIDPSTNDVVEIDLPFFWPGDYLSITQLANSPIDIGHLRLWELNQLEHSNGSTDPITISATAWFIDPILTMPTVVPPFGGESERNVPKGGNTKARTRKGREKTVPPVKQGVNHSPSKDTSSGNDEYGKGAVSAPASALANFAGTLEKVPFIGAYATATKIAASKVSSIAKLFGYSRPIILDNQCEVTQRPFGSLAMTSGDEPISKLTLDPKQEVTIDPVVTGLSDTDEMSFAHLFKRESLIVQVPWTNTATPGTNLVNIAIHPQVCPQLITPTLVRWDTALSWASFPFLYWRGTLNYRIQIVASQMHRGRLRVSYQPVKHAGGAAPAMHLAFNQVMDLTECRDMTFSVRYTHFEPWLAMHLPNPALIGSGAPNFNQIISSQTNGIMTISILNQLGAPVNPSTIHFNVFISAGDDFMVAAPGAVAFENLSPFTNFLRESYTSGERPALEDEVEEFKGESSADYFVKQENDASIAPALAILNGENDDVPDVDNENLVFFGEQIVSMRALLKRYCLYRPIIWDDSTSRTGMCICYLRNPTIPVYPGPTSLGGEEDESGNWTMGTNDDDGPYNFVQTTLISWYRMGYAGWRGSVRYKYIIDRHDSPQSGGSIYVNREPSTAADPPAMFTRNVINNALLVNTAPLGERLEAALLRVPHFTYAGSDISYQRQKNGIEFEMPYYFNQRFMWNKMRAPTLANIANGNNPRYQQYGATARSTFAITSFEKPVALSNPYLATLWCATGEDFSFHYFTAAPILGFVAPFFE